MADPSTPPATPSAAPPAPRVLSRQRKWFFRIAAATLVPALAFAALELGLRAAGYGRPARFFLDGSDLERPGTAIDNREFGRWVFPGGLEQTPFPVPFAISDDKPADAFRVFVLGESAAMGFPEPSVSFPRVLEVLLRDRYPDTRVEVVNAAVVAINSHVVLPIARECGGHAPDLFVVHLGNNEVVGPFGAAGVLGAYASSRDMVRLNLAVRASRTGQLLGSAVAGVRGRGAGRTWKGMEMFVGSQVRAADDRLPHAHDHLRHNLADICRAGADSGAPVVVCTVPVNLRDCAPFGSLHATNLPPERVADWEGPFREGGRLEGEKKYAEALVRYRDAGRIDDEFAELAYRQGRCLLALGRPAEAKEEFARARDLDTLRFRADSAINRVIREVALERAGAGVHLADAEAAFADASPGGAPGEELFLEHVHMTFSGNYVLARTVFQTVAPLLDGRLRPGPRPGPLAELECATRLAYTDWNRLKMAQEVRTRILRRPPFTAQFDHADRDARWDARVKDLDTRLGADGLRRVAGEYQQAVAAAPADWMLRSNFGQLLNQIGDLPAAEEQFAESARLLRHNYAARLKLGQICLQTGRFEAAARHFEAVIQLAPDWPDGHLGLAETLGARGKVDDGLAIYEAWLDKAPNRTTGLVAVAAYLTRAGRLRDARRRLVEAADADPDDATPYVQLGDLALQEGNRAEAVAMYEAALKRRPDNPDLEAHIGRVKAGPAK